MNDTCGMWVYAAVPPRGRAPGLTGVADEPLSVVDASMVAAVVGRVPLAEFTMTGDRVERIARAHHRVLTELRRHTALVPFRLGTVLGDEAAVEAMLGACAVPLIRGIELATGRTEWGVKVFVRAVPAGPAGAPPAGGGSGTAYLMRRRAERQAAELRRQQLAEHAESVHRALAGYAAASRRYPPHDRDGMVLNAAYLVPENDSDRLVAEAAEIERANPALRIEVTGPWPPYCAAVQLDDGAGAGRR
ncbi:GvpL/GvpF family gas vesicle protein [Actinoplanes sp. NPDC049681]|uniref:GvpL/GvpF family gas vesicle protein n=1 Tax=Actinoplanes sp. NPDC049681 TaxID=3363905 RepID=UPI00379A8473